MYWHPPSARPAPLIKLSRLGDERKRHLVSPYYYVCGLGLGFGLGLGEKKTSGVTRLLRLWAASHLDRLHSTVNNWVTAKDILMMQMISKLGQMISNIFNQKMWKYCNPSCSVNYRSTSNACITQNGSQDPAKSLLQLPSNGGPPCLELCFLTLPLVIEANSDIVTPVIDIFKLKLCCVLLKSGHGRVKNF